MVDLLSYKESFVYKHRLMYIVDEDKSQDEVQIVINFPLLPRLLKDFLRQKMLLNQNQNRMVDLTQYPCVQGYLMETEFFAQSSLFFAILVDNETAHLHFHSYYVKHVEDVLVEMTMNTLYRLRSTHLVIDAVGLLKNEIGEAWLVFVQISKKPYGRHSPSLWDLLANNQGQKGTMNLLTLVNHLCHCLIITHN